MKNKLHFLHNRSIQLAAKSGATGGLLFTSAMAMAEDAAGNSNIDVSSVVSIIAQGVIAATTIGVAVLGMVAGMKIYKMLKSAA